MRYAPLLVLLYAAPVVAQDTFALDPVYVSRFQPATPAVDAEAERVRTLLEDRLRSQFVMIERKDVPAFPDYSAEVYLVSCPAEKTLGCAFVVGARAEAEWVVTGAVAPDGEELRVTVSFVDVVESRIVFSFDVALHEDDEAAFGDGVADLLDKLVRGAGAETDLRGEIETPLEKAEREEKEREMLAASLAGMQSELDVMARQVEDTRIEAPKLTARDMQQYADRDDVPPWQRIGMNESEYVRYRNSGRTLNDWRVLARGRAARPILSLGIGTAAGPWGQEFDGRRALDDATLTVVEVDEYQELDNGTGLVADLEASFGVHRWIEVGFAASFRNSPYQFLFHKEVENEPAPVDAPSTTRTSSWQLGGRAHFVPMSTWAFRPTGTVGIGVWKGSRLDQVIATESIPQGIVPLPAPSLVLLELGPGGEVDLGPNLTLFAKGLLELPVVATAYHEHQEGAALLATRGSPDGTWGAGLQLTAGVRVRLGPLWQSDSDAPTLSDDEPDF